MTRFALHTKDGQKESLWNNTHSFDLAETNNVQGFPNTSNRARHANCIYENAAIRNTTHFVTDRVVTSPNSRMAYSEETEGITDTANFIWDTKRVLRPWSYPIVVNHLLKSYARYEAITEENAATLFLTKFSTIMPLYYGEALFAKTMRVEDVYDDRTLNDTFINRADELIRHGLQGYWATHRHVELTNMAFKAQSLLAIRSGLTKRNQTQENLDSSNYQRWGRRKLTFSDSNALSARRRLTKWRNAAIALKHLWYWQWAFNLVTSRAPCEVRALGLPCQLSLNLVVASAKSQPHNHLLLADIKTRVCQPCNTGSSPQYQTIYWTLTTLKNFQA